MIKDTITVNSVKKSAFVGFAFASLVALSPAHAMDPGTEEDFPTQIGRCSKCQYNKPEKELTLDEKCSVCPHVYAEELRARAFRKLQEDDFQGKIFDLERVNDLKAKKFTKIINLPTKYDINASTKYSLFKKNGITWYADVEDFNAFQKMEGPVETFKLQNTKKLRNGRESVTDLALKTLGTRVLFFWINGTHRLTLTGIRD